MRFRFFRFFALFGKLVKFSAVVTFLSYCWAGLKMIIVPALAIFRKDASVLLLIKGICVAIVAFSMLLIVCGAIAILKVVN